MNHWDDNAITSMDHVRVERSYWARVVSEVAPANSMKRDPADWNDYAWRDVFKLQGEPGRAVRGLSGRWRAVVGRAAAHGVGYETCQLKLFCVLPREAKGAQHGQQPSAGAIAGERNACAVGTVAARRFTNKHNPCGWITVAVNDSAPAGNQRGAARAGLIV